MSSAFNLSIDLQDGKKFVDEVLSRISLSTDGESAVKSTDLVIEAIVEKMEVKQSLFKALDAAAPEYVTMHFLCNKQM